MHPTTPVPDPDRTAPFEPPVAPVAPRRPRRALAALAVVGALAVMAAGFVHGASSVDDRDAASLETTEPTSSTTEPTSSMTDESGSSADSTTSTTGRGPGGAPSTPVGAPVADGSGPAGDAPDASPDDPPAPIPAVLLAPASLDLLDGVYEGTFELRNVGGSPLAFGHMAPQALTVTPAEGTIEPGQSMELHVSYDWTQHPVKHWVQTIEIASNGGAASVDVTGTTLLPPQFQITGGSYAFHAGLVYHFAPGQLTGSFTFKNDGDLYLSADLTAGALNLSNDHVGLVGGGETAVFLDVCGLPILPPAAPGIPVVRTIHVETNTWQGSFDLTVVFTLLPGQPTPPCA